jgi:hypothetical protein
VTDPDVSRLHRSMNNGDEKIDWNHTEEQVM